MIYNGPESFIYLSVIFKKVLCIILYVLRLIIILFCYGLLVNNYIQFFILHSKNTYFSLEKIQFVLLRLYECMTTVLILTTISCTILDKDITADSCFTYVLKRETLTEIVFYFAPFEQF